MHTPPPQPRSGSNLLRTHSYPPEEELHVIPPGRGYVKTQHRHPSRTTTLLSCNKWIFEDNAKGKLASRAEVKSLHLKIITACFAYLKELLEMGQSDKNKLTALSDVQLRSQNLQQVASMGAALMCTCPHRDTHIYIIKIFN